MTFLAWVLSVALGMSLIGNAIQFGMGRTAKRKYNELVGE